jgi:hypothetical protein
MGNEWLDMQNQRKLVLTDDKFEICGNTIDLWKMKVTAFGSNVTPLYSDASSEH